MYFITYVCKIWIISFLALAVITPVVIATPTLFEKEPISVIENSSASLLTWKDQMVVQISFEYCYL